METYVEIYFDEDQIKHPFVVVCHICKETVSGGCHDFREAKQIAIRHLKEQHLICHLTVRQMCFSPI